MGRYNPIQRRRASNFQRFKITIFPLYWFLKFGQFRANFGQIGQIVGRIWAMSGQLRPHRANSDHFRANFSRIRLGPNLAEFGPVFANPGPLVVKFGRLRPIRGKPWSVSAATRVTSAKSGRFRAILVEINGMYLRENHSRGRCRAKYSKHTQPMVLCCTSSVSKPRSHPGITRQLLPGESFCVISGQRGRSIWTTIHNIPPSPQVSPEFGELWEGSATFGLDLVDFELFSAPTLVDICAKNGLFGGKALFLAIGPMCDAL